MVFVEDDLGGRILLETEFLAGLVPKLVAVSQNLGSFDAVHHDTAIVRQYRQDFSHDFL